MPEMFHSLTYSLIHSVIMMYLYMPGTIAGLADTPFNKSGRNTSY